MLVMPSEDRLTMAAATTPATLDQPVRARRWARARAGLLAAWAAVTGAAPTEVVDHHGHS